MHVVVACESSVVHTQSGQPTQPLSVRGKHVISYLHARKHSLQNGSPTTTSAPAVDVRDPSDDDVFHAKLLHAMTYHLNMFEYVIVYLLYRVHIVNLCTRSDDDDDDRIVVEHRPFGLRRCRRWRTRAQYT